MPREPPVTRAAFPSSFLKFSLMLKLLPFIPKLAIHSNGRHLRRQLRPCLLRRHVLGVPVRPVLISLPGPLLVFAVRGLRTPKSICQVASGAEGSSGRVDPSGKPGGDLLQHPTVAVWISERCKRAITAAFGIHTTGLTACSKMEDFVYLDPCGCKGVQR